VIGIDPGLSGAFALIGDGELRHVYDMPKTKVNGKHRVDPSMIDTWLDAMGRVDLIVLEEVTALAGMRATSAFTFGQGVGMVQGILTARRRPWSMVTPQRWTRALGVNDDKGVHRQAATRLHPTWAEKFAKVSYDGRADAVLIAEYALRLQRLEMTA
jgi:hypothetical protein